jgi:hypothetical protein
MSISKAAQRPSTANRFAAAMAHYDLPVIFSSAGQIPGDGQRRHQERMAALDPMLLERKARQKGYRDLDVAAVSPQQLPQPTKAQLAKIAEPGVIVQAQAVAPSSSSAKKPRKPRQPRQPREPVVVDESDFPGFLQTYLSEKKHGKDSTLLSYLKRQFSMGKRWNSESHRFTAGGA